MRSGGSLDRFAPGASVSKVAQRYGVNANLLFTWRRKARSAVNGGAEVLELLPVTVADGTSAAPAAAPNSVGRMEIVLVDGERIVVGADVDAAALARVIKALRGDDPGPGGRSGVVGDGAHRHA